MHSMNTSKLFMRKMTITERNHMQQRLRNEMYYHARQSDWCREQILALTREYKEQNLDLYKELFHDNAN